MKTRVMCLYLCPVQMQIFPMQGMWKQVEWYDKDVLCSCPFFLGRSAVCVEWSPVERIHATARGKDRTDTC